MKPSVRFGLILGGIMVALPLVIYGLGLEKDESMQRASSFVNVALIAVVVFMGIREHREKTGKGFITLGTGFSTGMIISLIGGAISAMFTVLYFSILNPGMITFIKMKQENAMLERGLSEEQIEKLSGNMEFWTSPGMLATFALIGTLLAGAVISLICAAMLKKENPSEQIS